MSRQSTTHIQLVPPEARRDHVCLKWEQAAAGVNTTTATQQYSGCWAMDNFLVAAHKGAPRALEDHFDPVDPSNWLFFPGGRIKVEQTCLISTPLPNYTKKGVKFRAGMC
jgi:hypothetical protein